MNDSLLIVLYRPILWPFMYRKMFFLQGLDTGGKYYILFQNGQVEFRPRFNNDIYKGIGNDCHIELQGELIQGTGSGQNCNYISSDDAIGTYTDETVLKGKNFTFGNNMQLAKETFNSGLFTLIREVSFKMPDIGKTITRRILEV